MFLLGHNLQNSLLLRLLGPDVLFQLWYCPLMPLPIGFTWGNYYLYYYSPTGAQSGTQGKQTRPKGPRRRPPKGRGGGSCQTHMWETRANVYLFCSRESQGKIPCEGRGVVYSCWREKTLKLKCMHQSKSTATRAGVYALGNLGSISNGKTKRTITWCLPWRLFTEEGSLKIK